TIARAARFADTQRPARHDCNGTSPADEEGRTMKNSRRRCWLSVMAGFCLLLALASLRPDDAHVAQFGAIPAGQSQVMHANAQARSPQAPVEQSARAAPSGMRHDYIVQASSTHLARQAVERAGGIVTGELGIIRAVGAALDDRALAALWDEPVAGLRVYDDAQVRSSGVALPDTYYPVQSGASPLHEGGMVGTGVTVAVIDTGIWRHKGPLERASGGTPRVLAQYDAILAREDPST